MKEHEERIRLLRELFQKQAAALSAAQRPVLAQYIEAHSRTDSAILRQLWAVSMYRPYVRGRTLEWGCNHAPDSCMLRTLGATDLELHGCDITPGELFQVGHQFCGLAYRRLDHWSRLPYKDAFFDTVIADGVLEHVPNDGQSLAEVYRVLKPGGRFIICCLPNRYSATECVSRWLNLPHHLRTYTLGQTRTMLLHSGFRTLTARYYQVVPTLSGVSMITSRPWLGRVADWLWKLNPLLERLYPINRLASNLFLVSEKCPAIQWMPSQRQAA
jgi:SAM-dependent methyltransferase